LRGRLTVKEEVVGMRNDAALCEVVREWVAQELPGDRAAAERAARIAQESYVSGESLDEVCERVRSFVGSWSRHPSHWKGVRDVQLPLAI
jgi:hypothetical protein